jgi:hypothetical protein
LASNPLAHFLVEKHFVLSCLFIHVKGVLIRIFRRKVAKINYCTYRQVLVSLAF